MERRGPDTLASFTQSVWSSGSGNGRSSQPAADVSESLGSRGDTSLPAQVPEVPQATQCVTAAELSSMSRRMRMGSPSEELEEEREEEPYLPSRPGLPPSREDAKAAHGDISELLHPRRSNGKPGHCPFEAGNDRLYLRMTQMRMLLWIYMTELHTGWTEASSRTAAVFEAGPTLAKHLRAWASAFISDRHDLPLETRGVGSKHSLLNNDDLRDAIVEHLQKVGMYVRALDIVEFLADPGVQRAHGLKKSIGLSTAQGWMHELSYRWMRTPKGQYVDGHERDDVVHYRQTAFLPRLAEFDYDTPKYNSNDGSPIPPSPIHGPKNRPLHYLYHDESQFYAHDRRELRWVGPHEKALPRRKGEGASLMVADLVCPEFGWFRSKDGTRSARVIFRAGKNRDGYFTNQDILTQLASAMDICETDYPECRFCFVLDNATIHLKRADDALSARHMSKWPTREGMPIFGVDTHVIGSNGKPVYGPDGKLLKKRIRMRDTTLPDGAPQSLYFPDGRFKGMAQILEERGFQGAARLRAECPKFKCPPGATQCCCRRLLYDQPDFRDAETLVEALCHARGFHVLFLPKFHCELNPIEQCWCVSKRTYRELPPSSLEADLERNMLLALDAVTVEQIRW